jgi:hypothetical protein
MKRTIKLLGFITLALALVFGMTVLGCEDEEPKPPPQYEPAPGETTSNPINRVESINLGTMTDPESGWRTLLTSIQDNDKFINLDLSACTMSGTEFNPDNTVSTNHKIVSLILPDAATSTRDGTSESPTFKNFLFLASISGANITSIGKYAFSYYNLRLRSANFPKVTSIGDNAFDDYYGSLIITMGATAPTLGRSIFGYNPMFDIEATVKVKIPNGATGYTPAASPFTGTSVTVSGVSTTPNWANGLRGGGWTGTTWSSGGGTSYIESGITLIIELQ